MSAPIPDRSDGLPAGAVALALALLTACAGAQKGPSEEFVWPVPPDKPRVRYVRSIRQAADVETGFFARLMRAVGGGSSEKDLINPSSVALSLDESTLYVACPVASRVVAYDLARHTARRVADIEGTRPATPFGLAVDGEDRLYITDSKIGVVWVYSRDGRFLSRIGAGKLVRPTGIAIDRKRQLVYVVDPGSRQNQRHVVEVFAPDGRHLRTTGSLGAAPGQFNHPSFAAVSPEGNLYVADTANARLAIFDPAGALVSVFGTLGDAPWEFAKPKGMAFDALGNLHVVDGELGRVQILDPNMRFMMYYGEKSLRPELLQLPGGLAITSKNEIFIADYGASSVTEYLLFDTSPGEPARPPAPAPAASAAPATK